MTRQLPPLEPKKSKFSNVLLVDDDKSTLKVLSLILGKHDINIETARSGEEAQKILREKGTGAFDGVLTDYRMPSMSGLDLISWINGEDSTLATVMLTAEADKYVVAQSLREGACDFVEKPFKPKEIASSVTKAIGLTRNRRYLKSAATDVKDITIVQEKLNQNAQTYIAETRQNNAVPKIDTRFYPIKETGGDFINFFLIPENRLFVLAGDVSGHDLKAGFISAYFQGIVCGMVEMNASLETIAKFFNHFLIQKWNSSDEDDHSMDLMTSLAACFLLFDLKTHNLTIHNHGFPLPKLANGSKKLVELGKNGPPLGWFDELTPTRETYKLEDRGICYLWSDGTDDFAATKGVSPMAFAYFMFHEQNEDRRQAYIEDRKDDILIVKVDWNQTENEVVYEPIFSEIYAGDRAKDVDAFQKVWEESMKLCLPELNRDRMREISLGTREALLNGFQHGCKHSADCDCQVSLSVSPDRKCIRLEVEDGGTGFDYKNENVGRDDDEHVSFGLKIIKSFSQNVEFDKNGALLRADFSFTPKV